MTDARRYEVEPRSVDMAESGSAWPRPSRAHLALIAVCILHALSPIILRGAHAALAFDETVYISQLDPHVPAAMFTAPRSRGMTLLTAPASYLSASLVVMRLWLALLSGIGLFLALIPWLRLRKGAVVPVAALLWSGLWVSIYYSYEAMPDQYVAYGALAATGWLLLALGEPTSVRYPVYTAISLAFIALVRPTDSFFLVAALAGAVMVVRGIKGRRRIGMVAVMVGGVLAGFAQWVIEAYQRYGGLIARFHTASADNAGGLHWAFGNEMRNLAGPILCRPCSASAPLNARLWWYALVPLVALGLVAAWRLGVMTMHVVATTAALTLAAEYLFTINYSSPRFLEPTYALLALPIAEGVLWAGRQLAPKWRLVAAAAAAIVFALQLNNQFQIVGQVDHSNQTKDVRDIAIAKVLKAAGVRSPCNISGYNAAQIAFMVRCHDIAAAPEYVQTHRGLRRNKLAEVLPAAPTTVEPYTTWREYALRDVPHSRGWLVWLSPRRAKTDPPPTHLHRILPPSPAPPSAAGVPPP
jgi:hypothetical protein